MFCILSSSGGCHCFSWCVFTSGHLTSHILSFIVITILICLFWLLFASVALAIGVGFGFACIIVLLFLFALGPVIDVTCFFFSVSFCLFLSRVSTQNSFAADLEVLCLFLVGVLVWFLFTNPRH